MLIKALKNKKGAANKVLFNSFSKEEATSPGNKTIKTLISFFHSVIRVFTSDKIPL